MTALVGFELLQKKQALGTLNFYPDLQKPGLRWEGATPIITLGLVVQNTSNKNFTLNSLSGNIYANDYFVGNVSNFTAVTIQGNRQTTLGLTVRLSLIGITNDIIRAIQTGNIQQDLLLQAHANIDGFQARIPDIKYLIG